MDQRINDRGILIDQELVDNAIKCDQTFRQQYFAKSQKITVLDNPNSPLQLKTWLSEQGVQVDSLAKDAVADLVKTTSGQVIVNTARFLGYDKDDNGNLVINPEQAKVVKRIFYECLTGKSAIEIARELTKEGLKNGIGRTKWHSSGIIKILRNEKYIGDALLQKTYTVDFLTKKRIKNDGQVPHQQLSRGLPSTKFRRFWTCAERASQQKEAITMVILTPTAFLRLSFAVAARISTPGAFGIDLGLAKSKRSTFGAVTSAFTGTIKENAAWDGQLLKQTLKKLA